MSSYRKSPVYFFSVNRAPPNVSMDEFKAQIESVTAQGLQFQRTAKTTRKCDLATIPLSSIIMNNTMDDYVKAAGLPNPRPIILTKTELYEERELKEESEVLKHPALATDSDIDVSMFFAHANIMFERQSSVTSTKRAHCLAILELPEDRSAEECEKRLDVLLDRFMKRPVVQKNILKFSLVSPWLAPSLSSLGVSHRIWKFRPTQDSSMNDSLREEGWHRLGKHTLIIHGEYASQQDLMEALDVTDPTLAELIVEAVKDFDTPGTTGFSADVVTKLEQK
ncbi:hypothetical protein FB45DRAFT_1024795 [Roridomyces roridus]|uniref:Uncharacterized protein n=1 Tax=Roridomyces roridus TaxID=1738132 RepID=A0AAD7C1E8_9AGAR|nr:hypothetical protein FB45DRAFT_1024795 [Roridomyces roridus]